MYQTAKKCNYVCLFLVCTTAFIMSLYATAFCSFVNRNIELQDGATIGSVCSSLDIPQDQCTSMLDNHGVGFWAWEMTIPVDEQACFSYTQYVDGVGYVTPEFDRKFNSARACQTVSIFFGMLAWFVMMFSACCPIHKTGLKCLSACFFIAFFFQGLAFLIFKSDICDVGFFSVYFGGTLPDGVVNVSCSRNRATNMAIAATVLYFYAMTLVHGAQAPDPVINFRSSDETQAVAPEKAKEEMSAVDETEAEGQGKAGEELTGEEAA